MHPESIHTGGSQPVRMPVTGAGRRACLAGLVLLSAGAQADPSWVDPSRLTTPEVMLLEGDILVAAEQPSARGIGLRGPTSPWQDGIVPYQIDASLSKDGVEQVHKAIAAWNVVSGVSLMPLGEVPADLQSSHILFQSGPGCASWVGRQGGEQPLWVGSTCSAGSVMHEIGHALGLEHEHTRPDRDQHIVIHRDKIDPTKLHNFEITDYRSRVLGDYDYASIMHYGPAFFSVDGSPTMEPLVPTIVPIGQRDAPSAGDLESIARLYGTDLSLVTETPSVTRSAVGTGMDISVTLHVTNESDQGANGLTLTLQKRGLEVIDTDAGDWQCERAVSSVSCTLERLQGNAHQPLHLQLRGKPDAAGLRASLDSVTPDNDADNNTATVVTRTTAHTDSFSDSQSGTQSTGLDAGLDAHEAGTDSETDGETGVSSEVESGTHGEAASVPAASPTPLAAIPDVPGVESLVPLFETAPDTQTTPIAGSGPPQSTAGASVLWLPLLLGLVRRLAVQRVELIGKAVRHRADA